MSMNHPTKLNFGWNILHCTKHNFREWDSPFPQTPKAFPKFVINDYSIRMIWSTT